MLLRSRKSDKKQAVVIPYQECPAKTFLRADGTVSIGRKVEEHCKIVGTVAKKIIEESFTDQQRALFDHGAEVLCAVHDIGKVSPTFCEKIFRATTGYIANSHTALKDVSPLLEKQWSGHGGISMAELTHRLGQDKQNCFTPGIAGQHHGFMPSLMGRSACCEDFGGDGWHAERQSLLKEIEAFFGCTTPAIENIEQARLLSGLTTVADWIGSGSHFEDPADAWDNNVSNALTDAGISIPKVNKALTFKAIFDFEPNETQSTFIKSLRAPGLNILEAPMGLGKTEAALFAGYLGLEKGSSRGIYFALPTQLTSNKIHDRTNAFLSKILDPSCSMKAKLLHGSAWFSETSDMGEDAAPGGGWFDQGKRGILAPFGVGTIDQALMAVMNVKHGFVRAFGLAGKTVIFDEVHSYDTYTSTILIRLIQTLIALRCTVIVLSATLNRQQREQIMGESGLSDAYPLVCTKDNLTMSEVPVVDATIRKLNVKLTHCEDASKAQQEALNRAQSGQQVLWIENTVKDAQQRYLDLKYVCDELGIECGLIHSRFVPADRQENESKWVDLYGKGNKEVRKLKGRILIGTQVLEQSLDIDADFLISRFCPTDMLFQRLGRLWRHAETWRVEGSSCDAWIIIPSEAALKEGIKAAFGSSSFVYWPYILARSLTVWKQLDHVKIPAQIRPLINATYELRGNEDAEIGQLFRELNEGERRRGMPDKLGRNTLNRLAQQTLTLLGASQEDERPATRYTEEDTIETLMVKSLKVNPDGKSSTVTLLDGTSISLAHRRSGLSRHNLRRTAALLAKNTLSVSPRQSVPTCSLASLMAHGLQHYLYIGPLDEAQNQPARVRVALVHQDWTVESLGRGDANQKIYYRPDLGYYIKKTET